MMYFIPTVNLLDRHVETHPDKTAIIWERDEQGDCRIVTYKYVGNLLGSLAWLVTVHSFTGSYLNRPVRLQMP